MEKVILIRYGEVWLKSEPVRNRWEQILASNIMTLFPPKTKIHIMPGRIMVYEKNTPKALSRVFGVVSYSPAFTCEKDINEIKKIAKIITSKWKSGTFAIHANRTDKSFSLNSKQIEISLAEPVNLKVDLSNPSHELFVEIRDKAYIYEKTIQGAGGLPLGTAGKFAAHLRNNKDLVAVWLLMKRGALPILIKPKPNVLKALDKWSIGKKLKVVKNITEARKAGAIALVDSVSLKSKENGLVVFNPIIGFSEKELSSLVKKILS